MKLGLRLLGKLMWRLVLLAWEKAIRGTGAGPEGDQSIPISAYLPNPQTLQNRGWQELIEIERLLKVELESTIPSSSPSLEKPSRRK